jgi:transposase
MIRWMEALTISDPENMILARQDEMRRNDTSRYDPRLHGVLLVAQGMTCPQVAEVLGDSPRTGVNWVQRFEAQGLAGLSEGERPGRPRRLNEEPLSRVETALRSSPTQFGLPTAMWDGPMWSAFLGRELGVKLEGAPVSAAVPPMGLPVAQTTTASRAGGFPTAGRA